MLSIILQVVIMKFVVIIFIGWACISFVTAQDKTCSAFCSSLGMLRSNPGKSCNDIYTVNKASRGVSGNYLINTTTGVHQVYCDMKLECGGHKGGWMRIADVYTSRGDGCPSEWTRRTTPVAACSARNGNAGCYPTSFSTRNIPYSKVCGMAVGYQKDSTDGFATSDSSPSINDVYVDGISITYGTPRKHIWTYAIGQGDTNNPNGNCPCFERPGRLPPSFVHDNYYCESGRPSGRSSGVYTGDPVWDGKGCSDDDSCCSDPSLPWFYRQLPLTTRDDIETRICRDESSSNDDILIRELQLYVQ